MFQRSRKGVLLSRLFFEQPYFEAPGEFPWIDGAVRRAKPFVSVGKLGLRLGAIVLWLRNQVREVRIKLSEPLSYSGESLIPGHVAPIPLTTGLCLFTKLLRQLFFTFEAQEKAHRPYRERPKWCFCGWPSSAEATKQSRAPHLSIALT